MKRLFVSSTFKDMHYERDAIRDFIIPQLNKIAFEYCEDYIDICDLRWGIDTSNLSEESAHEKVLKVCLDEIDRCDPPMIILLGYRYGYILPNNIVENELKSRQIESQISYLNISVSALEIEYGALMKCRRKDKILFYFREIEETVPSNYIDRADLQASRLNELKERIKNLSNSIEKCGGKLRTYKVHWREDKIVGIENFSEMLINDLITILKPEWEHYGRLSELEKGLRLQWNFVKEKNQLFSVHSNISNDIIRLIANGEKSILIKGVLGSGKSTLFSNIAFNLKKQGFTVLPIICGLTEQVTKVTDVLKSCINYLQHILIKNEVNLDVFRKDLITIQDYRERLEELCSLYTKTDNSFSTLVIMLDAADQLLSDKFKEDLLFIPARLSHKVRFIWTCSSDYYAAKKYDGIIFTIPHLRSRQKFSIINKIEKSRRKVLANNIIKSIVAKKWSINPLYISLLMQRLLIMDIKDFESNGEGIDAINKKQIDIVDNMSDDISKICADIFGEIGSRINSKLSDKCVQFIAVTRHGLRVKDLANLTGKCWNMSDFSQLTLFIRESFILRADGRYDFFHKSIREGILNQVKNKKSIHKRISNYLLTLLVDDPLRVSELSYHIIEANEKEKYIILIKENHENNNSKALDYLARDTCKKSLKDNGKWFQTVIKKAVEKEGKSSWLADFVVNYLNGHFEKDKKSIQIYLEILKKIGNIYNETNDLIQRSKFGIEVINIFKRTAEIYTDVGGDQSFKKATKIYDTCLNICDQFYKDKNDTNRIRTLSDIYEKKASLNLLLGHYKQIIQATNLYIKSLDLRKQISDLTTEDKRNLAVVYHKLTDLCLFIGDYKLIEKGLYFCKKDLDITNQICECIKDNINNDKFYRDLAISYEKEGDVYLKLYSKSNDLNIWRKALESYNNSFKINCRLVDCFGKLYMRGKFIILQRIGDAYMELGKEKYLKIALKYFSESQKLREMYCENLGTWKSLRDLAFIYERISSVYLALGGKENLLQALDWIEKDLNICQEIGHEQQTAESKRDLFVCYCNKGEITSKINILSNDFNANDKVLELFLKSLDYLDSYARENPSADDDEDYLEILTNIVNLELQTFDKSIYNLRIKEVEERRKIRNEKNICLKMRKEHKDFSLQILQSLDLVI